MGRGDTLLQRSPPCSTGPIPMRLWKLCVCLVVRCNMLCPPLAEPRMLITWVAASHLCRLFAFTWMTVANKPCTGAPFQYKRSTRRVTTCVVLRVAQTDSSFCMNDEPENYSSFCLFLFLFFVLTDQNAAGELEKRKQCEMNKKAALS